MIEKLKKRINNLGLNVKALIGSTETLPFEDSTFHVVLSESVTAFTNIPVSIKEYARVLDSQGVLFMVEMTREDQLLRNEIDEIKDFYGITAILTEDEWVHEILNAGFSKVETKEIIDYDASSNIEFDYSENIDVKYFEILNKHQFLLEKYFTKLGAKIFW